MPGRAAPIRRLPVRYGTNLARREMLVVPAKRGMALRCLSGSCDLGGPDAVQRDCAIRGRLAADGDRARLARRDEPT